VSTGPGQLDERPSGRRERRVPVDQPELPVERGPQRRDDRALLCGHRRHRPGHDRGACAGKHEGHDGLPLIGLDRDPNALWIAGERLAPFADRVLLTRARFDGIEGVLDESNYWASESGHPEIDGILFDLGVSSMQLDRTERGFSYAADAPLDMRMDPDAELTAAEVVNTYDEKSLARILREFGEERFASRIASRIVRRRASRPFARTGEIVELLYEAIPAPARRTGGHPAKRTFQALRIAVNGELDVLRGAIPFIALAVLGFVRLVVLFYVGLDAGGLSAERGIFYQLEINGRPIRKADLFGDAAIGAAECRAILFLACLTQCSNGKLSHVHGDGFFLDGDHLFVLGLCARDDKEANGQRKGVLDECSCGTG